MTDPWRGRPKGKGTDVDLPYPDNTSLHILERSVKRLVSLGMDEDSARRALGIDSKKPPA